MSAIQEEKQEVKIKQENHSKQEDHIKYFIKFIETHDYNTMVDYLKKQTNIKIKKLFYFHSNQNGEKIAIQEYVQFELYTKKNKNKDKNTDEEKAEGKEKEKKKVKGKGKGTKKLKEKRKTIQEDNQEENNEENQVKKQEENKEENQEENNEENLVKKQEENQEEDQEEDEEKKYKMEIFQGQVCSIISVNLFGKQFGYIQIKLLYSLKNLKAIEEVPKEIEQCSAKNIFISNEKIWIPFADIIKKIYVIKWETLENQDNNTHQISKNANESSFQQGVYYDFYIRAEFNKFKLPYTTAFNPPISEWKKYCICDKIHNYDDQDYVECKECEIWYHYDCSGLTKEQKKNIKKIEFICHSCRPKLQSKNLKKRSKSSQGQSKKESLK